MSARREGASLSQTNLRGHYSAWLQHHRLSAADSLSRVLGHPVASILTWLVIGIALALPVGLNIALDNVSQLRASWESPASISVFLNVQVTDDAARALQVELASWEQIRETQLIARDDALDEFRRLSGFTDVLASLGENPLPHLVLVTPVPLGDDQMAELRAQLQQREGVSEAVLDMAWLQRLASVMELSRRLVIAVGAMLIIGALLILGNTIRLAIESRREEIIIVKLVGGSNGFVRRPFLYSGLWYGAGGGLLAGLLVSIALWFLEGPIGALVLLYESNFSLSGLGLMGVLNLVIVGGCLGLSGAWLAVSRHISRIEPR